MLLTIVSTFLHNVFTSLGELLHGFNGYFTYYIIGLAADAPPWLQATFYFSDLTQTIAISLISCIFGWGAWKYAQAHLAETKWEMHF